jgi:phosphonoacetaldehyde hydrolase
MWTIAVTATGNEIALTLEGWEALAPAERAVRTRNATRRLMDAGAHFTAPSLADCTEILADIERRITAGEKP